jgi:hypothetical protein
VPRHLEDELVLVILSAANSTSARKDLAGRESAMLTQVIVKGGETEAGDPLVTLGDTVPRHKKPNPRSYLSLLA